MTDWHAPNQQAVGIDPAAVVPEIEPQTKATKSAAAGPYDPGAHSVSEVLAYVEAHPDKRDAVVAAEAAGKNRTTITGG